MEGDGGKGGWDEADGGEGRVMVMDGWMDLAMAMATARIGLGRWISTATTTSN